MEKYRFDKHFPLGISYSSQSSTFYSISQIRPPSHAHSRSLYENQYIASGSFEEVAPLFNGLNSSQCIPNYGSNHTNISDASRKYSISHPITLPRAPRQEDLLSNLHPLPPLPALGAVALESEARWRNFHHKKGLADSILQHSTEPPLGRHLRMAVRSCLHMAEVSPECIAVDQAMHPWESIGPSRHQPQFSRPAFHQTASIRAKFGHRHSKSTASIVSNPASLRSKTNEAYSSQGAMLMSEDSLRKKGPNGLNYSPSALKKVDRRRAQEHKPLFVEVFSPDNGSDSDDESGEPQVRQSLSPNSGISLDKPIFCIFAQKLTCLFR